LKRHSELDKRTCKFFKRKISRIIIEALREDKIARDASLSLPFEILTPPVNDFNDHWVPRTGN